MSEKEQGYTAKHAQSYQQLSEQYQFINGMELIDFAEFKQNENVFDLGAGTGELTYEIGKLIKPNGVVVGVDADSERIMLAKEKHGNADNVTFVCSPFEIYQADHIKRFDVIFSNQVLHWIIDKNSMLKKVAELLVPDGRFVFQCITKQSELILDIAAFSSALQKGVIEKYNFTSRDGWMRLLEKNDFSIVKQERMDDYHFESLHDFLFWLEATTHGIFQVNQLSEGNIKTLLKKYPGDIYIFRDETLKLSLKCFK